MQKLHTIIPKPMIFAQSPGQRSEAISVSDAAIQDQSVSLDDFILAHHLRPKSMDRTCCLVPRITDHTKKDWSLKLRKKRQRVLINGL